jgi:hypothetical protein
VKLTCKCGNEIIKSYPGDKSKLRTNILIFEDGKAFCKCSKCHEDVFVPVILNDPTKKVQFYVIDGKMKK